jgi:hypothetical protein
MIILKFKKHMTNAKYYKIFQQNLKYHDVDLFFGKIKEEYTIASKNILLLENNIRANDTSNCFCNWGNDKIFELSSFEGFKLPNEPKINLASKECSELPSKENIEELFDIIYNCYKEDIFCAFNMVGAGASVSRHFHSQILYGLQNNETFHKIWQNLQIDDLKHNIITKKINRFSIDNEPESIFQINRINTPIPGVKFSIAKTEFRKISYQTLLNNFTAMILDLLSQVDEEFAFNFLYYGLSDNFEFNIIFRNPKHEIVYYDINPMTKDIAQNKSKWGWLEAIGGLRIPGDVIELIKTSNMDILDHYYKLQTTNY